MSKADPNRPNKIASVFITLCEMDCYTVVANTYPMDDSPHQETLFGSTSEYLPVHSLKECKEYIEAFKTGVEWTSDKGHKPRMVPRNGPETSIVSRKEDGNKYHVVIVYAAGKNPSGKSQTIHTDTSEDSKYECEKYLSAFKDGVALALEYDVVETGIEVMDAREVQDTENEY